jgi:hypothetical protein
MRDAALEVGFQEAPMRSSLVSFVVLGVLSFSGLALAQDPDDIPPPPPLPGTGPEGPPAPPGSPRRAVREARERAGVQPVERPVHEREYPAYIHTWVGMSFEGGGGAGTFFDDQLRDMTGPQGDWTARFTVGTRHHLAGEAAYLGSAQKIHALGLDSGAALVANGVEGALRLNLFTGPFQPYISGGIGWRHFSVRSELNRSDVESEKDTMHFPLAAGIAIRAGGFIVDGRACFRPTYGTLAPGSNASTWDVTGNLGFEF